MKEKTKKKASKWCLILLLSILLESVGVKNAFAISPSDINNNNVFLEQARGSVNCTTVAASMMLRRRAILNGDENWERITPGAVESVGWLNGFGMKNDFSYGEYNINSSSLPADKTGFLIELLKSHPEGVVIYSKTKWHAVLITDYTDGQFYCGDPAADWRYKGRIPLSLSSMETVDVCYKYWYISTPYQKYTEGWIKNEGIWKYQFADGSFATGWKEVSGKWYYLDGNGIVQTGWQNLNGKYYYLYDSGEMATGWLELDEGYYYLGSDGVMYTDRWVTEDGIRYRLGADGRMLRNICSKIDGVEYDFDHSGAAEKKTQPAPLPESMPETTSAPTQESAESKNQVMEYSYQTRTKKEETKTSEDPNLSGWECVGSQAGTGSWSSWSGWSEESRESSSDTQVETRTVSTGETVQIYLGRYYSAQKNKFSPSKLDSTYAFEGGWFEEDSVTFVGQAYAGGRSDCYTVTGYHYYFFEIGSHGGETRTVSTGTKTEYRYRQKSVKTIYQYRRTVYTSWSEWSTWSETPVEENEYTKVRTRSRTVS
jgi:hypothetical protein